MVPGFIAPGVTTFAAKNLSNIFQSKKKSEKNLLSSYGLASVEENEYYKGLIKLLIEAKKINFKLTCKDWSWKKIDASKVENLFKDEDSLLKELKESNEILMGEKYNISDLINWFIDKIGISNELKFIVLLNAWNVAEDKADIGSIEIKALASLVKLLYGEKAKLLFWTLHFPAKEKGHTTTSQNTALNSFKSFAKAYWDKEIKVEDEPQSDGEAYKDNTYNEPDDLAFSSEEKEMKEEKESPNMNENDQMVNVNLSDSETMEKEEKIQNINENNQMVNVNLSDSETMEEEEKIQNINENNQIVNVHLDNSETIEDKEEEKEHQSKNESVDIFAELLNKNKDKNSAPSEKKR